MGYHVQITPRAATVMVNGVPKAVDSTHPNFDDIVDILKSGDFDLSEIEELMDVRTGIMRATQGKLQIAGDRVLYNGQEMHGLLTERLLAALEHGGQYFERLIKFAENYYANPSYRSREQLWPFLEHGQNPIDENGRFLAWKLVRNDYKDIHSGRFSNHIGAVIEMDRTQVDEDPNRTCSAGLHVCTWHYLPHFGSSRRSEDRVMIVAIDPKDVVAVPTDYDNAKMRVCKYTVVGEVAREDAERAFPDLFADSDDFAEDDDV